jgi:hypothetical protein
MNEAPTLPRKAAMSERGGQVFPPGRPKGKREPLGGREPHAVGERGGLQ